MKKIVSVFICLVMVLSLIPFTVSAADSIDFKLRLKEETDSTVTLTIDYDGGTGFSALDFEVTYDRAKLQADTFQEGKGYEAFAKKIKKDGQISICELNSRANPLRASIANTVGFSVTDGKKSVVEMKFIKAQGTKFSKEDINVEFTNCQTASFTDIKVSFAYDLSAPAADGNSSADVSTSANSAAGQSVSVDSGVNGGDSADNTDKNAPQGEDSDAGNGDEGGVSRTTVVIIVVVAVVFVAGAAAFVALKKKKN